MQKHYQNQLNCASFAQPSNACRITIHRSTGRGIQNLFQNAGHLWSPTLCNKFIIISSNHKRKIYCSL